MKTFLNSFGNLINGYSLLRAEHPSNTKRGWYLYVLQKLFTSYEEN